MVKEYGRHKVSSAQVLFLFLCVLLFFLLVFSFFRELSIILSVRYFFVEAYPFKIICEFCEFCEISKNNFSYRTPPVVASILKRVLFKGKFHLGHRFLIFPNLYFISLTTKNKLNLQNNWMLELHKKRLS